MSLSKDNAGISGIMGGGSDQWGIQGTGSDDSGRLKIYVGDNGTTDWLDFEFRDYTGTTYTPLSMTGNQISFNYNPTVSGNALIHAGNISSQSVNYANYSGYSSSLYSDCTHIGANQLYSWYDWGNTGNLTTYFYGIWVGSPDGNIGYQLAHGHDDYNHLRIRVYDYGGWNPWHTLMNRDDTISWSNVTSKPFNWSGQSGQPTWLWGSNDGTNYYVWNPSNFSVNYANSAGSASVASGLYYNSDGTLKIWSQSGGGCPECGTETMCIQSLFDGHDPYTDPYGYIPVYTNRCVIALQPKGGYVGINNTAPSYPLHISGNVGGTNFYATSDRHLKKCISNISTSSLEHLFSVSDKLLKKFTWKGNNKKTYGFIAQELEKYIPEAVDINNDGKFVSYNIAYAKIIASLINEIKKLKKDNQMIMKLIQSS